MIISKQSIGKLLVEGRKKLNMSRNKIAQKLGTGYERVKMMEEGEGNYGIDKLIEYLNIIKCDLSIVQSTPAIPVLHKPTASVSKKVEEPTVIATKKSKKRVIEDAD